MVASAPQYLVSWPSAIMAAMVMSDQRARCRLCSHTAAMSRSGKRAAIANFEISLGNDHPFTWWAHGSLSTVLRKAGRFAEAEAVQRRTLMELERISGVESADAQWVHELMAETFRDAGRAAEAEAEAARAKEIAAKLAKAPDR